ncbi:MAG: hypothetical protein MJZ00_07305 [Paludibacteraceae bacterium]|nr:hypothetical protein [Paludibacteraceae bacterium]
MRKVQIEYKIWGIWKSLSFDVPERMDEMSQAQMISIIRLYMGELSEEDFLSQFFSIKKRLVRKLEPFQRYKLAELVDFTRKEDSICTDILIKEPDGKKHPSCPLNMLRNTSFKQFMLIDTLFSSYLVNHSDEVLQQMMDAIYCYDTSDTIACDKAVMMAVLFNWMFLKNMLTARFPLLFPPGDGEQHGEVVKWLDIFDNFVGDDVAHMYDYERMLAMDVMRIMNKRINDYNMRKIRNFK